MFCIYDSQSEKLSSFEEEEGEFIGINEAEELLRSLQAEDPDEFARITNLRDGIRSARASFSSGGERFVFCQSGKYQQLFMVDGEGKILFRDVPQVLARVKCSKSEPAAVLPTGHNEAAMKILEVFSEEVRNRTAQQRHSVSLTIGQTYVLRELRAYYDAIDSDEFVDLKGQIELLEESFKLPLTAALKKQCNTIRRNGVTGKQLADRLSDLYRDHGMSEHDFRLRHRVEQRSDEHPRVICSEAFI